jgi:hypothetical protein
MSEGFRNEIGAQIVRKAYNEFPIIRYELEMVESGDNEEEVASLLSRSAEELRIRALSCRMIAERILDAAVADELRTLARELEDQAERLAAGDKS